MEQKTQSSIIQYRGNSYGLKELPKSAIKITELEEKIIETRISGGLSISQMESIELKYVLPEIIMRVTSITGIALPATDLLSNMLVDELTVFLKDFGYSNLNPDELILAFRFNSRGGLKQPSGVDIEPIDIIGSFINVHYVSKVLSNYMAVRNILDSKLKNLIDGY